jgi:hypothetical protein
MKLNESSKSFEENYILPNVKLHNNSSNYNKYDNQNSKKKLNNSKNLIGEIKLLLKDMQKCPIRTTNFSIILYLDKNNYERLSLDSIKEKLTDDFSKNHKMFINTKTNQPFESERNIINSLNSSITRNKSFISEIVKKKNIYHSMKLRPLNTSKKCMENIQEIMVIMTLLP